MKKYLRSSKKFKEKIKEKKKNIKMWEKIKYQFPPNYWTT